MRAALAMLSSTIALIPNAGGEALSGVLLIDIRSGTFRLVEAKAVLLATGGGPTMYRYHTPSGDKSMDGLAMALDAGLGLRDMEMVQFHPTGLLAGSETRMTGTVLEEGLRGAGGYLLNGDGERFMMAVDPLAERATRDIVSRAIYREMQSGRTTQNGGVHLQMHHLGADTVAGKFKGMVERCADCGFDLAGGLVEVVPTAHYLMGGVVCDVDTSTRMDGLFVAGEDAGGVHGANRLGGNGVANSTVYGGIAGETMATYLNGRRRHREPDMAQVERAVAGASTPLDKPSGDINGLRERLLDTMWQDVGVIRSGQGMSRAIETLESIENDLLDTGLGQSDLRFNLTWHDWLNLKNLISVSKVIAHAALQRENSRGAHYRDDFSSEGELAASRYTVVYHDNGKPVVTDEAVDFTIVRPGETLLQPAAAAAS